MYCAIASRDLQQLAATRLLDKPFAEPPFNFFLRNSSLRVCRLKSLGNFLDDVQVILNVLKRAVVR
jgi:hypothetical protein